MLEKELSMKIASPHPCLDDPSLGDTITVEIGVM